MSVCIRCCAALLIVCGCAQVSLAQQPAAQPKPLPPATPLAKPGDATAPLPMSDEERANALSDQVGKLMVKCVNLLSAQDPMSLDFCKQQRDLADQYPAKLRMVDKMMAHDEYGIALAAFDHKQEALDEFDREIALVPKAVKPGSPEWSTAYWHRAMLYAQMGQNEKADHDYRAAEENFRKPAELEDPRAAAKKRRMILRQHAALLQKEGKADQAQKLIEEASK